MHWLKREIWSDNRKIRGLNEFCDLCQGACGVNLHNKTTQHEKTLLNFNFCSFYRVACTSNNVEQEVKVKCLHEYCYSTAMESCC